MNPTQLNHRISSVTPRHVNYKILSLPKTLCDPALQNIGETVTPMQLQSSLPRVHKARHFNILDSPKTYSWGPFFEERASPLPNMHHEGGRQGGSKDDNERKKPRNENGQNSRLLSSPLCAFAPQTAKGKAAAPSTTEALWEPTDNKARCERTGPWALPLC